jgi:hypothetical protein
MWQTRSAEQEKKGGFKKAQPSVLKLGEIQISCVNRSGPVPNLEKSMHRARANLFRKELHADI